MTGLGAPGIWYSRSGDFLRERKIVDMTSMHLRNAISKLRRRIDDLEDLGDEEKLIEVRLKVEEMKQELARRPPQHVYRRHKIKIVRPSAENAKTWCIHILKWNEFKGIWKYRYGACGTSLRAAIAEFREYNPYWSSYHGR